MLQSRFPEYKDLRKKYKYIKSNVLYEYELIMKTIEFLSITNNDNVTEQGQDKVYEWHELSGVIRHLYFNPSEASKDPKLIRVDFQKQEQVLEWIKSRCLQPWFDIKQARITLYGETKESNKKLNTYMIRYTGKEFNVEQIINSDGMQSISGFPTSSTQTTPVYNMPNKEFFKRVIEHINLDIYEFKMKSKVLLEQIDEIAKSSVGPFYTVKAEIFGSTMTHLALDSSDVDINISIEPIHEGIRPINKKSVLFKMAKKLESRHYKEISPITTSQIPILKLFDPIMNITGEIMINNTIGKESSTILKEFCRLDSRVRHLVLFIKLWQKKRSVKSSHRGLPNSFCLSTMLLARLVELEVVPPIMRVCCPHRPATFGNVQEEISKLSNQVTPEQPNGVCVYCHKALPSRIIDGSETYCFQLNRKEGEHWKSPNTQSTTDLLLDFFKYYGQEHKIDQNVISVRLGGTQVPRDSPLISEHLVLNQRPTKKVWQNASLLVVESPFKLNLNCWHVRPALSVCFRHEFKMAYLYLMNNNWDKLLEEWKPGMPEDCQSLWDQYFTYRELQDWISQLPKE